MNQPEFQSQIARLRDVYGEKAYSDERVRLIWREVSSLDGRWFERAVDQLISSSRQAPLLSDMAPLISVERERLWQVQKKNTDENDWNAPVKCSWCRDRGTYLCTRKSEPGARYAFRCHCDRGHGDPRKFIPQYKQCHRDEGFEYYETKWGAA